MYTLEMVVANIRHTYWWWDDNPIYKFGTIEEALLFMKKHIPMRDRDIAFILDNDKKRDRGNLANTSWYLLRKGEPQMTEYTSF